MKRVLVLAFPIFISLCGHCQMRVTLEACYDGAEANYPMVRQRSLLEKVKEFSLDNASRASLPRISIAGQASYQSDVTRIPIDMPGVHPLSKDQYRIYGELAQTLYHGGMVHLREGSVDIEAEVERQQLEIDLYEVRSRINDLFFGVLLLQEQIAQSDLVKKDIGTGLKKVQAAIRHGTALQSAADVLQAEVLRVEQRIIEMRAAEALYRKMLAVFTGIKAIDSADFVEPVFAEKPVTISRPELRLFKLQEQSIESSEALLLARNRPKVELFVQGGYGRPGLNMLDNDFDSYYVGGIRLSWMLSGYYTLRREQEILHLRQQSLDARRETFLLNTRLALTGSEAEIEKLRGLIDVDDRIIALRTRVRETAQVQFEQGVISASDFVREVNAEDQAKQSRALHKAQLLKAQAQYHFTSGQP